MSSIFICYDSLDIDHANDIRNMFELENIHLGDIDTANVYLFIFSEHSNNNDNVIGDLDKIVKMNKKFTTLQYTKQKPGDELSFYISTTQWEDMSAPGAMDKLLKDVLYQIR